MLKSIASFAEVPKMSKAMAGDSCFCLMVLAVVTIGASPLDIKRFTDEGSESCQNSLMACFLPAVLPYVGLNDIQMLEKVRNTPLSAHCTDFTAAGDCARNVVNGDSCFGVSEIYGLKISPLMEAYDFTTNYICQEHFDKFNQNFRCLMSSDIQQALERSCKEAAAGGYDDFCEAIPAFTDCFADAIRSECGEDASSISRELNAKLFEYVVEMGHNKKCSTYEFVNRQAILKRFLTRK